MNIRRTLMHMATVSAAALISTGAVSAQSTETEDGTAVGTAMDGQVLVEQGEPQVSVTIDEPAVDVSQAAPQVTVEQPQPEILVSVPEPNVMVEQQAPIITVEQAQPTVTVRIPEPIITIRVPRPNVDVSQSNPDVDVTTPEPVVQFIRPEPRIVIEENEPNIQVEQARVDSNVNVSPTEDANVQIEQAEAQVEVQQSGDADVEVATAEPVVNIDEADGADVNVSQADAQIRISEADAMADESGMMTDEEQRAAYRETMQMSPFYDTASADLVGLAVLDERGIDVGEIDFVGLRGDTAVVIVGAGGFLGLGEHSVAVPLNRLEMRDNAIVLPMTEEELEALPEYEMSEVTLVRDNTMTIGEMLDENEM